MFKLQRLEITGFKSFADYTEIIFTGDGITAVVGPNGCGKSNVSDAISWVLGEQKAKSLRGDEMKDFIFQGTSKRKPSGMAEVVLHMIRDEMPIDEDELSDIDEALGEFDDHIVNIEEIAPEVVAANGNGNGHHPAVVGEILPENGLQAEPAELAMGQAAGVAAAPAVQPHIKTKRHWRKRQVALDFAPGEAVSITRRLYLSGDSEYQINGKTCRLRDIHDLFSGTGLSGAHYALIEQGRIGQILSAKPSDRRTLIEEAAGISKFRTRQRAAELRLDGAKTNLRRITDIVEEIDKQVNSLRRQASKTRRYKILKEELRELQRKVFVADGRYLSHLVEDLGAKLKEAAENENKLFADVSVKEEAVKLATQKARGAEESLSELRAQHAENALLRDRTSRELIYQEDQIKNIQERLVVLKGEIESTELRLKLIKEETGRLEEDEKIQRAEAEKQELELGEAESTYSLKIDALRAIEDEIEQFRSELLGHTTAVERFAEIERQLENGRERLSERAEGLKREGERANETFAIHTEEKEKLEKVVGELREKVSGLQGERQKLSEAADEHGKSLQASNNFLMNLREEYSRIKHRLETLQEIEEKRTIYAAPVQKILADQEKIGVKFLGTLADKLNVRADAEKAVESVFGSLLQAVLVGSDSEAKRVAEYLGSNNAGRIAILNIGDNADSSINVESDSLLSYLGIAPNLAAVLRRALPKESSAKVVKDFDSISNFQEGIYVTLGGDLLINGKLYICGRANEKDESSSLLAFKRELRELQMSYEELAKDVEKAERETSEIRHILAEKEKQIIEKQVVAGEAERELISQEVQLRAITQEIERAERHRKVVEEESKQIEKDIADIQKRHEEALQNFRNAESSRKGSSERIASVSEGLTAARLAAESENSILNEKRMQAATSAERRRAAQAALRRIDNEQKEYAALNLRQIQELEDNEKKIEHLKHSIVETKKRIDSVEEEKTSEQGELATAVEALKTAREFADATAAALAELNHNSAAARNARAEIEIRQTEAATRLENLNENCATELNQTFESLVGEVEVEEEFDLETARTEVDSLRKRIEGFGAVNMLALEELTEAEERFQFLTSQRQDIVDSIASAEEALKEIKVRSRERFRHAFTEVNKYFSEFFVELFGGGKGEMTLLEADDILEAGIEIIAQPPGKRLQNIQLLSGGEKAMTAIALVMAIFQYRPSPFCLLDEVDAPLDDANVGRFVTKIEQMSEKTQFIVITHNKRTMEAAKALYGVTMQEAGVSKVLSVKFE